MPDTEIMDSRSVPVLWVSCTENPVCQMSIWSILGGIGPEQTMKFSRILLMLAVVALTSGCVAVAAGTAGALIVDEGIVENDGVFDPFENTELGRAIYGN